MNPQEVVILLLTIGAILLIIKHLISDKMQKSMLPLLMAIWFISGAILTITVGNNVNFVSNYDILGSGIYKVVYAVNDQAGKRQIIGLRRFAPASDNRLRSYHVPPSFEVNGWLLVDRSYNWSGKRLHGLRFFRESELHGGITMHKVKEFADPVASVTGYLVKQGKE